MNQLKKIPPDFWAALCVLAIILIGLLAVFAAGAEAKSLSMDEVPRLRYDYQAHTNEEEWKVAGFHVRACTCGYRTFPGVQMPDPPEPKTGWLEWNRRVVEVWDKHSSRRGMEIIIRTIYVKPRQ